MSYQLSRRRLLAAGAAGAGFATLGGLPMSAWAQTVSPALAGKIQNLVIRYRTDPERIARVLPPGLEVDDEAHVMLDWWVRYPTPGQENIYYPDIYSECGLHVTAKYQGRRGMLQVDLPLDQEWGRTAGREGVGLVKKDGVVKIARNGREITASLNRRGKLVCQVKTQVVDKPAHPVFWHRETGFGAFLYRYRLDPNWRDGPLSKDPVELWLRVLGGKSGEYPGEMTPAGPRECDRASTQLDFVEPSVLDGFAEFPVREMVGISYSETGFAPQDEAAYRGKAPRTPTRIERLQFVDRKAFEPWALMNYDRPITESKPWVPAGWPEKASAFKLTDAELAQYRARPTLNLDLKEIVDLRFEVGAAVHAQTLPPPLKAGSQPIMRILAVSAGANDLSADPFTELWLMSRCETEAGEAWYALSNIVGYGGDILYGRETFGHPSKMGAVDWSAKGSARDITGRRMGRTFARLEVPSASLGKKAAAQASLVIGLRRSPPYRKMTLTGFEEIGPQANLIAQPWSLELAGSTSLDLKKVKLEFPRAPGPGQIGAVDPWFEFDGGKLIAATLGKGVMRRSAGRDLGAIKDYQRFYMERMDGTDDSALAMSGAVKHTFLGGA